MLPFLCYVFVTYGFRLWMCMWDIYLLVAAVYLCCYCDLFQENKLNYLLVEGTWEVGIGALITQCTIIPWRALTCLFRRVWEYDALAVSMAFVLFAKSGRSDKNFWFEEHNQLSTITSPNDIHAWIHSILHINFFCQQNKPLYIIEYTFTFKLAFYLVKIRGYDEDRIINFSET